MKILYTGPLNPWSVTEFRRRAFIELGHQVMDIDEVPHIRRWPWLLRGIHSHALIGPGVISFNAAVKAGAEQLKPDLIYIDQAMYLWPSTIRSLKQSGATLVHYTSEGLWYKPYIYRYFLKAVPLYDAHVITNKHNIPILTDHRAKQIVLTEFGTDPGFHYPRCLSSAEKIKYEADAVIVGHWEPFYEEAVQALRDAGMSVAVYGPYWKRSRLKDRKKVYPMYGEEALKALTAARIGLALLSKWNRNETTCRTFEIPSVGTFMLGERTRLHCLHFEEGKEAEFFESTAELVEKAKYYLAHSEQREGIAQAGRHRCFASGYTHLNRIREILQAVM